MNKTIKDSTEARAVTPDELNAAVILQNFAERTFLPVESLADNVETGVAASTPKNLFRQNAGSAFLPDDSRKESVEPDAAEAVSGYCIEKAKSGQSKCVQTTRKYKKCTDRVIEKAAIRIGSLDPMVGE